MPIEKLGVGMMNRHDISSDGYAARFHAIKASGAKELDMFIMRAHLAPCLPLAWPENLPDLGRLQRSMTPSCPT